MYEGNIQYVLTQKDWESPRRVTTVGGWVSEFPSPLLEREKKKTGFTCKLVKNTCELNRLFETILKDSRILYTGYIEYN